MGRDSRWERRWGIPGEYVEEVVVGTIEAALELWLAKANTLCEVLFHFISFKGDKLMI